MVSEWPRLVVLKPDCTLKLSMKLKKNRIVQLYNSDLTDLECVSVSQCTDKYENHWPKEVW